MLNYSDSDRTEVAVAGESTSRWQLTMEHLWLGLPVFVLLWKNFLFQLPVLDFWWHLKLGELIASTHSIPRTDLFSFTATGQTYVVQNWLAELIYYGLYRLDGFPLIAFVNSLITLAAFLPIYLLCLRATKSVRTAAVVSALAAFSFLGTIRPQTFSFLMFALFYWILENYRLRRSNRLWLLPLLMILWVNLHGAFVIGFILMAGYIVAEGVRRLINGATPDVLGRRELVALAGILVLCVMATVVNPEGYKVYEYVRTVVLDTASQRLVSEWQPPRINDLTGLVLFYIPFFLTLAALIFARTKPTLTEVGLFFGFGILALTAVRNGAWFNMVAYPILARYLPLVDLSGLRPLCRFGFVQRLVIWFEEAAENRATYGRINLMFAGLAFIVLFSQSPWMHQDSLLQDETPVAAVDFIQEHHLQGNIFHPQIFGDYMIWRLYPEQKSFFDGRVHLYGLDFVRRYMQIFHDSHWEDLLANWQIRYLLLSKNPVEKDSLDLIDSARSSGHWKTLYEDKLAILLEKTND